MNNQLHPLPPLAVNLNPTVETARASATLKPYGTRVYWATAVSTAPRGGQIESSSGKRYVGIRAQHGVHFALRPQKRDGSLGTGTGGGVGEGDERVKVQPRIPPEKDRRDRGPPPERGKC